MVYFRYIIVNTLHKGDNNDEDDNDDDDNNNNNNNNNNNSTYSRAGVTAQTQLRDHDEYLDSQVHKYDTITHTQKQNKRQIRVRKSNCFYKYVYLSTDQVCCFYT